jgi:hypothetical protein
MPKRLMPLALTGKKLDDGALVPLWDKTRTPLPLPLTGTDKSLALMRTDELAKVFSASANS